MGVREKERSVGLGSVCWKANLSLIFIIISLIFSTIAPLPLFPHPTTRLAKLPKSNIISLHLFGEWVCVSRILIIKDHPICSPPFFFFFVGNFFFFLLVTFNTNLITIPPSSDPSVTISLPTLQHSILLQLSKRGKNNLAPPQRALLFPYKEQEFGLFLYVMPFFFFHTNKPFFSLMLFFVCSLRPLVFLYNSPFDSSFFSRKKSYSLPFYYRSDLAKTLNVSLFIVFQRK